MINEIPIEHFRELCALAYNLTELKLGKVEHLSIENFASDVLAKLITAALYGPIVTVNIDLEEQECSPSK